MLPCAGQGALAIETRADDAALIERLGSADRIAPTRLAVAAERAVSRALGGSCSMPLAAHAAWRGDALELDAAVGHPARARGAACCARAIAGPVADERAAEALGRRARRGCCWRPARRPISPPRNDSAPAPTAP